MSVGVDVGVVDEPGPDGDDEVHPPVNKAALTTMAVASLVGQRRLPLNAITVLERTAPRHGRPDPLNTSRTTPPAQTFKPDETESVDNHPDGSTCGYVEVLTYGGVREPPRTSGRG